MPDTITLYYKCSKCGKVGSQINCPEFGMPPYMDCPYCGGSLVFEPNCYICGLNANILECNYDCKDFSKFVQMTPKERN
jgi:DNA-directed RNA polymerase subunit RPC12/RpoP